MKARAIACIHNGNLSAEPFSGALTATTDLRLAWDIVRGVLALGAVDSSEVERRAFRDTGPGAASELLSFIAEHKAARQAFCEAVDGEEEAENRYDEMYPDAVLTRIGPDAFLEFSHGYDFCKQAIVREFEKERQKMSSLAHIDPAVGELAIAAINAKEAECDASVCFRNGDLWLGEAREYASLVLYDVAAIKTTEQHIFEIGRAVAQDVERKQADLESGQRALELEVSVSSTSAPRASEAAADGSQRKERKLALEDLIAGDLLVIFAAGAKLSGKDVLKDAARSYEKHTGRQHVSGQVEREFFAYTPKFCTLLGIQASEVPVAPKQKRGRQSERKWGNARDELLCLSYRRGRTLPPSPNLQVMIAGWAEDQSEGRRECRRFLGRFPDFKRWLRSKRAAIT